MQKLNVKDLRTLSENDQELLFNYFSAKGGVDHRRKMALGIALFGWVAFGMTQYFGGLIADVPDIPSWIATFQSISAISLPVVISFGVFAQLWIIWTLKKEIRFLDSELVVRELDVSGLSFDEVFEHVALPMFRRAGVRVKD